MTRSTALLIALIAVLLILADSARAVDWPPFGRLVELQERADRADELERANARLRRRNRKLQRHLYGYGRWVRSLRRTLRARADVREAIGLAATVYGVSYDTLWRKAGCETGGAYNANARNRTPIGREHASGLFQFLPSTFASTPFARFSIWSMYANSLAAGWMHAAGRGGEWACR